MSKEQLHKRLSEEQVKVILEMPDNLRPLAIIAVGYPAEEPEEVVRKPFESATYLNKYGNELLMEFEPIANALEEKVRELAAKWKESKPKKKFTVSDLLKRFTK